MSETLPSVRSIGAIGNADRRSGQIMPTPGFLRFMDEFVRVAGLTRETANDASRRVDFSAVGVFETPSPFTDSICAAETPSPDWSSV